MARLLAGSTSAETRVACQNSVEKIACSSVRFMQRGSSMAQLKCASNQCRNSHAMTPMMMPPSSRAVQQNQCGECMAGVKSMPMRSLMNSVASASSGANETLI